MKTKLILLALAITASTSLTSCADLINLAEGQRLTSRGDWEAPGSAFHMSDGATPCHNTCRSPNLFGDISFVGERKYTHVNPWTGFEEED